MNTIKITYPDDMTEESAVNMACYVIDKGRISNSRHGDSFSAHEVWRIGSCDIHVTANRTATMDTFKIWREMR